jgi:hypothetical protein
MSAGDPLWPAVPVFHGCVIAGRIQSMVLRHPV